MKRWFELNHFDAVIHLAAIVPIKEVNSNKKKAYDVNYIGTKNLVNEVKIIKSNGFFLLPHLMFMLQIKTRFLKKIILSLYHITVLQKKNQKNIL